MSNCTVPKMIYLGRHANRQASSTRTPDQVRRRDSESDARPAVAKRKKGEAQSSGKKSDVNWRLSPV